MMSVVSAAWVVAVISPVIFIQGIVLTASFEDVFLVYEFKFIGICVPELWSLNAKAEFGNFSSACRYFNI